jgi:ubiquinone/menaquinone biosynthesis C-methylase UbiE
MNGLNNINRGFSHEAEIYERDDAGNPVIQWMRGIIRNEVIQHVPSGGNILEINAGTGIDAQWFCQNGYRVHATDIADGMLDVLKKKSAQTKSMSVQKISFTELHNTTNAPFDCVFSNFGGLNCTPDLLPVINGMKKVLKPGGLVVWAFMPKLCPWEWIYVLKGDLRTAARRFKKEGASANVGGESITTYYFNARDVIHSLGREFEVLHLRSLSLFCPPMNMRGFIKRAPGVVKWLMKFDTTLGKIFPFNQIGDFLVLTAKYKNG